MLVQIPESNFVILEYIVHVYVADKTSSQCLFLKENPNVFINKSSNSMKLFFVIFKQF